MNKYACPCCGCTTLDDYDICPVCFWEDDPSQYENPDQPGGANGVSLCEAQRSFLESGGVRTPLQGKRQGISKRGGTRSRLATTRPATSSITKLKGHHASLLRRHSAP